MTRVRAHTRAGHPVAAYSRSGTSMRGLAGLKHSKPRTNKYAGARGAMRIATNKLSSAVHLNRRPKSIVFSPDAPGLAGVKERRRIGARERGRRQRAAKHQRYWQRKESHDKRAWARKSPAQKIAANFKTQRAHRAWLKRIERHNKAYTKAHAGDEALMKKGWVRQNGVMVSPGEAND